ncbi:MAG: phenylalanine--tRNA ligase subunit alpha [Planctomycetes bacterium]|nr:phenylalanine--tRNA ligase subunit alpha [Planctomycetota bacterium]
MLEQISELKAKALEELEASSSMENLDEWQNRYLSRKGQVKLLLKEIGKLEDPQEKKSAYGEINPLSKELERLLEERKDSIQKAELDARIAAEQVDTSLPGTAAAAGSMHPINTVLEEVCGIFERMGFQIWESPHVETDENNFEMLNIPPHHPARDMQDTFYVSEDMVLRTHTSPGQVRAMRTLAPEPIRVLLPGTVYRNEQITRRSEIQFNQVEGLAVGTNITMADLKGVLEEFVHQFFGPGRRMVLRGSYFPFTEPSVEVDIDCNLCGGDGCGVCKYTGWLEILGAGVVHPTVLGNGGYDPEVHSGFAFGLGIERMVMLRHGINDIRHFYAGNLRFLEQFD